MGKALELTDSAAVKKFWALAEKCFDDLGEEKGNAIARFLLTRNPTEKVRQQLTILTDIELLDVLVLAVAAMSQIALDAIERRRIPRN